MARAIYDLNDIEGDDLSLTSQAVPHPSELIEKILYRLRLEVDLV